ncbi:MAG: tRNA uridine-5-carboxymethylaminomethyl(34) synthesis GTPase MnmE [Desulfuromonadaceae bacterium]|nr:tRNA uridine-5-carboxymethylaminomethyl(34) synthesis GTPase MnmE [Desulfuromonadaceae bacterium]MDD2854257.1 tRNA uridine-5-carboxymethylaminomethyl(34) synthesis GTPase MnmE [Desulfuromonadaceae bacterium]
MYIRDTIAAVSTPPGNGGIGIIRVSGSKAAAVCDSVFKSVGNGGLISHRFSFGAIYDPLTGNKVDEAMAVFMSSPKSYTREDVLELHCHGGWFVVEQVMASVLSCGIRLAEPGEFTRRAFLNGRIDLVQAEAVMDIISSKTEYALKLAEQQSEGALSKCINDIRDLLLNTLALVEAYIDFPDDDLGDTDIAAITATLENTQRVIADLLLTFEEGRVIRDGISILIIGKPNVGKSSLLNCLLNENRAIVTHLPGTTRDIIEETVNFDGLSVRLLDTAGIRNTDDIVEKEGISRTLDKISHADLVLAVFDASRELDSEDLMLLDAVAGCQIIAVFNKSDLQEKLSFSNEVPFLDTVRVTALTGEGVELLKQRIRKLFLSSSMFDKREFIALSKARHRDALVSAGQYLQRFSSSLQDQNLELLALDLRSALQALGEVTGQTATDDVLDLIFSSFCIGK